MSLIFFAACTGAIITSIVLFRQDPRRFHLRKDSYRMTFRYLPGIIGSVSSIWYRSISSTYGRITPYVTMAAASTAHKGKRQESYHDTLQQEGTLNVFNPNLSDLRRMAKNKHLLTLALVTISALIQPFFVPLKNSFLHIAPDDTGWQIQVSFNVGYALVVSYLLFIFCTIMILVRMWSQTTGLKWDVVSIADQLALVQGSNILKAFHGLDFANKWQMDSVMKLRANRYGVLRLGYWRAKNDTSLIWHGIRFTSLSNGKYDRLDACVHRWTNT